MQNAERKFNPEKKDFPQPENEHSQKTQASENPNSRLEKTLEKIESLREKFLRSHDTSEEGEFLLYQLDRWYELLGHPEYTDKNGKPETNEQKNSPRTSTGVVRLLTGQETESLNWSEIEKHSQTEDAPQELKKLFGKDNLEIIVEKLKLGNGSTAEIAQALETQARREKERHTLFNIAEQYRTAREIRLQKLATYDVLCENLLNKRAFLDSYNAEVDRVRALADPETRKRMPASEQLRPESFMIKLDLNEFKEINDDTQNGGHAVGDKVLVAFGNIMEEYFGRESDSIARTGGDEFSIIARSRSEKNLLGHMAGFVREVKNMTIEYRKNGIKLRKFRPKLECGIGISKITKDVTKDKLTQNSAIDSGDKACYLAKEQRKDPKNKFNQEAYSGVATTSDIPELTDNKGYIPYSKLEELANITKDKELE